MPPSGETVPRGYWVCSACKSPNKSAHYPSQCPCGHYRDSCCFEAGSRMPPTFGYQYAGGPSEIPIVSTTAPELFGPKPRGVKSVPSNTLGHLGDFGGKGSGIGCLGSHMVPQAPPADAWECPNCKAANSGLTPDFCPICGYQR